VERGKEREVRKEEKEAAKAGVERVEDWMMAETEKEKGGRQSIRYR
jgi:hypothetical protein